jgi:hypothetical protein
VRECCKPTVLLLLAYSGTEVHCAPQDLHSLHINVVALRLG